MIKNAFAACGSGIISIIRSSAAPDRVLVNRGGK
jgi:hypothetical protein